MNNREIDQMIEHTEKNIERAIELIERQEKHLNTLNRDGTSSRLELLTMTNVLMLKLLGEIAKRLN